MPPYMLSPLECGVWTKVEFKRRNSTSGPELALLVCFVLSRSLDVDPQFMLMFGNTALVMQEVTRLLLS